MRRRAGELLPLEVEILQVAARAQRAGEVWVHGFAVARMIRDAGDGDRLTAHGTLYKALSRLDAAGLLEDRWEEPHVALAEGRPRRRLYRLTGEGQQTLNAALASLRQSREQLAPRYAP
jgi:DNA-binding PadR family transcriptional regulator